MKKIFNIIALSLLLLPGCSRQEPASPSTRQASLKVENAPGSKVFLNAEGHTVWDAGDKVSVFYGGSTSNVCATFSGAEGDASGEIVFETDCLIPSGDSYAVIPYSSSNSLSGTTLKSSVPSSQAYRDGSFSKGAATLVARTDGNTLQFRYACAVVALELESTSSCLPVRVKYIELHSTGGEKIAGDLNIDMADAQNPAVTLSGSGSDRIVMKPSGSGNLCDIPAGEKRAFHFCVAPCHLSKGYYFEICLEDGEIRTVRNTSAVDLEPGVIESLENGVSVVRSIIIDFDELTWTPEFPKKATTTSGSVHSFTNPVDKQQYSIMAISEDGGYYANSTFLRFNSAGSAMKLPMIEGMRLCGFGAMVHQNASKVFCVSSTPEAKGDVVPNTTYPNEEMIYSIVGGDVHEAYINILSSNTQIMRIELMFE